MKAVKSKINVLIILVFTLLGVIESPIAAEKTQAATPPQANREKLQSDKTKRIEFENTSLKMIVIPRTREQMKAFYEGRGFAASAISAIAEACFMTVIVKNKTRDILWLELNNWRFSRDSSRIKRLDRKYWKQRWETLQLPMANRSTFGWTLLPEQRDLRVDEGVGGNITLAFSTAPLELDARFYQGKDKNQGPVSIHLGNIRCAE